MKFDMTSWRVARIGWISALAALMAGSAMAQGNRGEEQRCPPDCDIDISVPADRGPPRLGNPAQQRTHVKPGEKISFTTPRGVGAPRLLLVFEQDSPFVDKDGNALYVIELPRGARGLAVRKDEAVCAPPNGCKYTVIDRREPTRKPLDPWIIIDR